MLKGLNGLFGAGLSDERLMEIGARLGSDVPFFIKGGTALCEGRGECVTPIQSTADLHFVLVIPQFGLDTARVYGELTKNDLTPSPAGAKILTEAVRRGDLDAVALGLYNRLERPSFRLRPKLRLIKQEMAALGFKGVLMSGSGSAIFGLASDMAAAESLAQSVHCKGLGRAISVRTLRHDQ
jgi:4-diphosphocytidyl-2-C-methyl-D-erythritol kinase